jgi:cellobiose phosphorylase
MILGLQRVGSYLQLNPSIPRDWAHYQINYRFGKSMYHIFVKQQPNGKAEQNRITMDDKVVKDGLIPLADDGKTHEIVVEIYL